MVVRKLAKFHAASFYLQNEQKYDFSHFDQTYHEQEAISEMLVGKTLKGLVEFLIDKEEFEDFIPALEHFRDNHQKMTLESYKTKKGAFGFKVLNHADFHTKNVLWKLSGEEKIENVCLVSKKLKKLRGRQLVLIFLIFSSTFNFAILALPPSTSPTLNFSSFPTKIASTAATSSSPPTTRSSSSP